MKKVFSAKPLMKFALATVGFFLSGCYDDSQLRERLDNYEIRLQALEKTCSEMNTNIASLQTIVTALQNKDFVTDIMPITENGKEIGYTLTFSKSGAVTIYHGKDGQDGQDGKDGADGKDGEDGSTPVVGVRQDTDGLWYWTLNGEWLLDDEGAKVRASCIDGQDGEDGEDGADGKDGEDGITPQLKIKEGYWFISYDNGQNWTKVGRATGLSGRNGRNGTDGKDGKDGKDGTSFFQNVGFNDTQVLLVLADGQSVIIPRELELSVTFNPNLDTLSIKNTRQFTISYNVKASPASADHLNIEVTSTNDVQARVKTKTLTAEDNQCTLQGEIGIETGSHVSAYSKVMVFVTDDRKVLIRDFFFTEK